ncbi:MAG: DUF3455 domain-containing protein [Bacteroidota bacterium]
MKSRFQILLISLFAMLAFASCQQPTQSSAPEAADAAVPEATQPAASETAAMPDVPNILKVSANEKLVFTAKAKGVQIYECKKTDKGNLEWVFKAPEATLMDESGAKIGTHYKNTDPAATGPAWELPDGSKVVGSKLQELPSPAADAIPWLLLEVKWNKGAGAFANVTKIQRVETAGGKAPAGGCDEKSIGTEMRVDYTATYYFYAINASK